jgi:hypothetical protein
MGGDVMNATLAPRWATIVALTAWLLVLSGGSPGLAQDLGNPKYVLQDRRGPDRREGLTPLQRSAAYVDLVGVFLDVPGLVGGGGPGDPLRLGFYLPESQRFVRIEVQDYDDIRLLVEHFRVQLNERYGFSVRGATREALRRLEQYPWRGNVREVEALFEQAMIFRRGD